MKKIYLFCTKLSVYWIQLPLIFILTVAIIYNNDSEELFKLYPLIVLCSAAIIFVFIYFFRLVELSYSEIKQLGLFSSRDKAIINEGMTIKLTMSKRGAVKISLWGIDSTTEGLSWMKSSDKAQEFCLFRSTVYGGRLAIKSVLGYFGIDKSLAEKLSSEQISDTKLDNVTVSSFYTDDKKEINIKIDKTI